MKLLLIPVFPSLQGDLRQEIKYKAGPKRESFERSANKMEFVSILDILRQKGKRKEFGFYRRFRDNKNKITPGV